MAQALIGRDDPLADYLNEMGEGDVLPGIVDEFTVCDDDCVPFDWSGWLPPFLLQLIASLFERLMSLNPRASDFAERFKYDVISSCLLSSSLPSSPPHLRRRSSPTPSPSHQRKHVDPLAAELTLLREVKPSVWTVSLACVAPIALLAGNVATAAIVLAAAKYYNDNNNTTSADDTLNKSTTLDALADLIAAGNTWDEVISHAFSLLEEEDISSVNGSTSHSSLHLSLASALHMTLTQCDNVRQLLAALTSPLEISQLSEMYAPSSPAKAHAPLPPVDHHVTRHRARPSIPHLRKMSSAPSVKRMTWTGSSPAVSPSRRSSNHASWMNRHSDDDAYTGSLSPSTPSPIGLHEASFGAHALDLQRERRRQTQMFGSTSLRSSFGGSRFTSLQSPRSPQASSRNLFSLSSLRQSLNSAIASKRWTCAHLLALRFEDEGEESYWEDVRSVMDLLLTTFQSAQACLQDSLNEAERSRSKFEDASSDVSLSPDFGPVAGPSRLNLSSLNTQTSFAPIPGRDARFMAHAANISASLANATEHINKTVSHLAAGADNEGRTGSDSSATASSHTMQRGPSPSDLGVTHPAVQSYDRLRLELGLALRECERGKSLLMDLTATPVSRTEDYLDDVPPLAHDQLSSAASSDSHRTDGPPASPRMSEYDARYREEFDEGLIYDSHKAAIDDASSHLLLTTSPQHLPPVGIEQVFESETDALPTFIRERSKLSREERIKLAKERRKETPPVSRWGPGDEVVQELKDVISKVGEQRRRMSAQAAPQLETSP